MRVDLAAVDRQMARTAVESRRPLFVAFHLIVEGGFGELESDGGDVCHWDYEDGDSLLRLLGALCENGPDGPVFVPTCVFEIDSTSDPSPYMWCQTAENVCP